MEPPPPTPVPPLASPILPNWPTSTYCIVSTTTPHQAIDALGMPLGPAQYTEYVCVFFYEILLWKFPVRIFSENILSENLFQGLPRIEDFETFESAKCDRVSYRGPVWPRQIGEGQHWAPAAAALLSLSLD